MGKILKILVFPQIFQSLYIPSRKFKKSHGIAYISNNATARQTYLEIFTSQNRCLEITPTVDANQEKQISPTNTNLIWSWRCEAPFNIPCSCIHVCYACNPSSATLGRVSWRHVRSPIAWLRGWTRRARLDRRNCRSARSAPRGMLRRFIPLYRRVYTRKVIELSLSFDFGQTVRSNARASYAILKKSRAKALIAIIW